MSKKIIDAKNLNEKLLNIEESKNFIEKNNLTIKDIENNLNVFLYFLELINQTKNVSLYLDDKKVKLKIISNEFLTDWEITKQGYWIRNFPDRELSLKFRDIKSFPGDIKYKEMIKIFLKEFPNSKGFYISGDLGVGKSFFSKIVANRISQMGYSVCFIFLPDYLSHLKTKFNTGEVYAKEIKKLHECDFLVIDDIGSEIVSNWSRDELLFSILNYRFDSRKVTWFTSNLTIDELQLFEEKTHKIKKETINAKRLINRIEGFTIEIKFEGKNMRHN